MSFFIVSYEYHYVWLSPYLHNIPPNQIKNLPNIMLPQPSKKKTMDSYGVTMLNPQFQGYQRVAITCGQYHWSHPWGARGGGLAGNRNHFLGDLGGEKHLQI